MLEISVPFHKIHITVHHVPNLLHAQIVKAGIGQHLWRPSAFWGWEQVQRIAELRSGQLALIHVVPVAFVDDDAVGHLHDTAFDALQLISRTGQLDEQEKIYHGMTGRFALSHAHRLHENLVETGSLAQDDRLTRLASHAA